MRQYNARRSDIGEKDRPWLHDRVNNQHDETLRGIKYKDQKLEREINQPKSKTKEDNQPKSDNPVNNQQ